MEDAGFFFLFCVLLKDCLLSLSIKQIISIGSIYNELKSSELLTIFLDIE